MPAEITSVFVSEAAAISVLLFIFLSLYRSHRENYFRYWVVGWVFSLAYVVTLLTSFFLPHSIWTFLARENFYTSTIFFAAAAMSFMDYLRLLRSLPSLWIAGTLLILLRAIPSVVSDAAGFLASALSSAIYFCSGFLFFQHSRRRPGLGARILSFALIFHGLHVLDRPTWSWLRYPLLPLTLDSLVELMLGIGMVVLVLEESRQRSEELNRKLRVLNTITSEATQYMRIEPVLEAVIDPIVEMLGVSHAAVRILEGPPGEERLRLRAQRGFSEEFLRRRGEISLDDPVARNVVGLQAPLVISARDPGWELLGQIMRREQVQVMVLVPLRGKDRVLGMLGVGDRRERSIRPDELDFLVGVANQLGVIVENTQLFGQVANAHRQWVYTFDSLTDYILVHDSEFRVMKTNRALAQRLGCAPVDLVGRRVREVYFGRSSGWRDCPFCVRFSAGGSGEMYEALLGGHVLVTTSAFLDPSGAPLGTIHVVKDINDRKLAEEKYKTLFESVEEGVFISTPEGKFMDFNPAFMRIVGFQSREVLLATDIAHDLYADPRDREKFRRLIDETGSVTDFEFNTRRPSGEIVTLSETSFAIRDPDGRPIQYQGIVIDITERKRAEMALKAHARQQAAVAGLGQRALAGISLTALMEEAVALVAETLDVEYCKVLELLPEGDALLLRAGVGWKEGLVGQATVGAGKGSQAGYTLLSREPVIVNDLRTESRFSGPPLLVDHGVTSGLSVIIPGEERPFGVLGAHTRRQRAFTQEDIHFLQAVANVLATAIGRQRAEEQLRLLAHAVETATDLISVSDLEGRLLFVNRPFLEEYGYTERELLGEHFSTLHAPNNPPYLLEEMQEQSRRGGWQGELLNRRKNGSIFPISLSTSQILDKEGKLIGYLGVARNITERRRAEEEIRRRNRELSSLNAIANTLSQSLALDEVLPHVLSQVVSLFAMDTGAVYLLDEASGLLQRKTIHGFQSEFRDAFPPTRLSPDLVERIRQAHTNFFSVQDLPFLPPIFSEIVAKEKLQSVYFVVLWAKDKIVGGMAVSSRAPREFSDADLNLLAAIGSQVATAVENIRLYEETRRAYEDLRRTQEQLLQSEKMAAVGQLISGVAHELNNPLTAILGYSQLLESSPELSPRASEYVAKLGKQAQRTHRVVQNLLSFARQNKPERRLVDINHVLEDTITLREYDLKLNNILVRTAFSPLPLTSADAHQLQQVFLNMLNNACDALVEESRAGTIEVRTCREADSILVEISDDGPGLKEPSRVFDPFYTTKAVGKGTGLGLSICYGIVKEHGGEIVAENRQPRGATFRMRLPILPGGEASRLRGRQAQEFPRGQRILLVDDEQVVLDLEREILSKNQFQTIAVRSGSEAIEVLEQDQVDLVVADLKMPGEIAGRELYGWIRQNRPGLAPKVVFTMSDANEESARQLLRETGNLYVVKPFRIEEFLHTIRQATTISEKV